MRLKPPPLTQDEAISAHEDRDSDDGYREWLSKNPSGYVINIQRSHNPAGAHLHDAEQEFGIPVAMVLRGEVVVSQDDSNRDVL